jgi:ATP dependent DNA ligase domain
VRYLWGCEEKVDGWRMLAYKAGDRVRLVSRNGRDHTRRFADLAAAIAKLSARSLVLDGEIAIYDKQLRFRFKWLRELDPGALATPPLFMAFELLYQENRDLTARPLRDRRARPEDVVANNDPVFPVRRLAPDGVLSENSSVAIVLRFCRMILYWPVRWLGILVGTLRSAVRTHLELALENRRAKAGHFKPVDLVLVRAGTLAGSCRRCDTTAVGRRTTTKTYPGITQNVAPNESQRGPKPTT